MGFPVRSAANGTPDLTAFRQQVEQGRVAALYVFDPGPEGSIGDVSWIISARTSGKLPLLIVQGVLMSDLARAADIVLPGASSMEKNAVYVNQQGIVQAASRALTPPGDAQEDWQVLVNLGARAGRPDGVHEQRSRAGGRRRGHGLGTPRTPTSRACRLRGRSRRRRGCRRPIRPSAGSGT